MENFCSCNLLFFTLLFAIYGIFKIGGKEINPDNQTIFKTSLKLALFSGSMFFIFGILGGFLNQQLIDATFQERLEHPIELGAFFGGFAAILFLTIYPYRVILRRHANRKEMARKSKLWINRQ